MAAAASATGRLRFTPLSTSADFTARCPAEGNTAQTHWSHAYHCRQRSCHLPGPIPRRCTAHTLSVRRPVQSCQNGTEPTYCILTTKHNLHLATLCDFLTLMNIVCVYCDCHYKQSYSIPHVYYKEKVRQLHAMVALSPRKWWPVINL
jgi:hypothetical protein